MRPRFCIRTLLVVILLAAVGIVVYQQTVGRDPIRRTNRFTWFDGGVGVVERIHTGAWDSHDVIWGPGSYLTLNHSIRDTSTFDGASSYRASFQMPNDVNVGDTIEFSTIPLERLSITFPSEFDDTFTLMLPGEFTAFRYGNPSMDWMPDSSNSTARVRIIAMDQDSVRVHIEMHAVLPDFIDLDLDQEFTAKRQQTRAK